LPLFFEVVVVIRVVIVVVVVAVIIGVLKPLLLWVAAVVVPACQAEFPEYDPP